MEESNYMDRIYRLALEKKTLVLLENRKSPCELPEITEYLKVDPKEVEKILDSLLVDFSGPKLMNIYNQKGECVKTINLGPQKELIKKRNSEEVRIKTEKAKGYLKKIMVGKRIFNELVTNEP